MDDPRREYLDDMRDEERVAALEADEAPDHDPFWDLPINPISGQTYFERRREWEDDPEIPRGCEE